MMIDEQQYKGLAAHLEAEADRERASGNNHLGVTLINIAITGLLLWLAFDQWIAWSAWIITVWITALRAAGAYGREKAHRGAANRMRMLLPRDGDELMPDDPIGQAIGDVYHRSEREAARRIAGMERM